MKRLPKYVLWFMAVFWITACTVSNNKVLFDLSIADNTVVKEMDDIKHN